MAKSVSAEASTEKTSKKASKTTTSRTRAGVKKKDRKIVQHAIIYIKATFNNTHVTSTDLQGNVIARSSAGEFNKGSRKGTPFAAQEAAEKVAELLKTMSVKKLKLLMRGPGPGRDSALKVFINFEGGVVEGIFDETPIPHNGPRPRKKRRV